MLQCSPQGRLAAPRLPAAQPSRRPTVVHVVASSSSAGSSSRGPPLRPEPEGRPANLVLLTLQATAVATAVQAVAASPAFAKAWQERRHHRRLVDRYFEVEQVVTVAKAEGTATQAVAPQAPALKGWQRNVRRAYRQAKRALQGDGSFSVASTRDMAAPVAPSSIRGAPQTSALGWAAVAVVVGAVALLGWGDRIPWPWAKRRRSGEGGRWVADRDLGGKMVWVPDVEKPTRSLYGSDLPGAAASTAAAEKAATDFSDKLASSTAFSSSASSSNTRGRARDAMPEWWVPVNTTVYCSPSRKEELGQQARATLRALEDAKLAGLDYPLSDLRTLCTLCQEGAGLQVKPRTENGRDAMLRAGVRAAMECAMEGNWQLLGGDEPPRFVAGLAHGLGVPDKRAVTITHAEVAACARALLIDAEAAYRASDQAEIMLSLVKLAQLLAAFPLPLGSAEAELLAGSIQQQTSLEFRKAIFFVFGSMDQIRAPIVAEMLGFNPELVMPQLLLQLQSAEQAQRIQQQAELAELQRQQQQGEAGPQ